MGDRCYMQITCRRQDQERFSALGFTAQDWDNPEPDSPLVVMVDEEANYAHSGELPGDIPYYGFNGAGGNYGDGVCACDGKQLAEQETGHDGGFVVEWDDTRNRPSPQSLRAVRRYLAVYHKVQASFADLAKTSPATKSIPSSA
jgi:hypothetical protein